MNRDDVIRMACDAGVWIPMGSEREKCVDTLERFASLIATAERDKLYALPGAQPAPSINEGVRKVTLDFRWESEAQHHIPTIEIEFEPVSPESPNDAKSWQDRDRLAAMLTPEAKP